MIISTAFVQAAVDSTMFAYGVLSIASTLGIRLRPTVSLAKMHFILILKMTVSSPTKS